jgi:uncharacterized protein (DUF849 family)
MMPGDKVIINAAITGCVLDKAKVSALPVTVKEIVECARSMRAAGASIVHLHARGPDGAPSYDVGLWREIVDGVRDATDLVVCVSTSGRHVQDLDLRAASLAARPDMASLTMGSFNFIDGPSVNAPGDVAELARLIRDAGAVPELEVFEVGHASYAAYLARKGVLRPPFYANLFMGSLGSAPLALGTLDAMVRWLPEGCIWAAAGIGRFQLDANVMALAAGGHVRVGLEDNPWWDRDRTMMAANPNLVDRIARIGRDMGREPATPDEARGMLGLPTARGGAK